MPIDPSPVSMFTRSLLIGFSIAAPVGPIGVLCIRRTLAHGRPVGLASGLGAATADALYGSLSVFGLTVLANFLVEQQFWFSLIGGIFLVVLGVKTFLTAPESEPAQARGTGLLSAFSSTFFLTLTNPMTILSFTAVYATLGLANQASPRGVGMLAPVFGVFCGSALWWLLLSTGVGWLRKPLTPTLLRWINRTSGVILLGFAGFALLRLL